MATVFLRAKDLRKSFASTEALKGINLEIEHGEICCLVGENGCGKSTLIKIISGVHAPDSGTIEINGTIYRSLTPWEAKKKGIEVIFQDFSVFPNLTVAENIAMNAYISARRKFVSKKEMDTIAHKALEQINVDLDLHALVGDLSVSHKQLVAIARALVHASKLIIMDEATAALTRKEVNQLFRVVERLKRQGIAVLFVSHKLDEVMEIAEKVIVLRNGEHIITGTSQSFDEKKIAYYMTGREVQQDNAAPTGHRGAQLMRVDGISQSGGFSNISFALHAGEVLGIMGALGSGKTALANALFGIHPVEHGEIYIEGSKRSIRSVRDAITYGIAYVPEDRLTEGLFLTQSIEMNAVSAVLERMVNARNCYDKQKAAQTASAQVEALNIKVGDCELPALSLSGGNQQKLLMGKWLASKPKILILNGPTVGVDIGAKLDIYELIHDLARGGMGIILISDEVHEVLYNSSKVYLMEQGRFVMEADACDLHESDLLARLGGATPTGCGAKKEVRV